MVTIDGGRKVIFLQIALLYMDNSLMKKEWPVRKWLCGPRIGNDPLLQNWTKLGPIINGSLGCGGHCNASAPGDRGKVTKTPSLPRRWANFSLF
jgi:hypothetical protein